MLRQLEAANRFDPGAYAPLRHGPTRIGWVEPGFSRVLEGFPDAFRHADGSVYIVSAERLNAAARALAASGWITGWRNERYDVMPHAGGEVLFTLERAAFRRFGMQARTVHLNGWVRAGDACKLWIARRCATKPIDPGMLDNLVGGGIAAASTPLDTLLRECAEEAAMEPELARGAVPAGDMRVLHAVEGGVQDEIIHVYDLELPADFVPQNRDGEVAEFMLLDPAKVAALLEAAAFTVDAAAVSVDFLWRKGLLRQPGLGAALAALREWRTS